MAVRLLLMVVLLPLLAMRASAQTPPVPPPGSVLTNPEAPRPRPPSNPSGTPPLPTIIPSTILTPGSGR